MFSVLIINFVGLLVRFVRVLGLDCVSVIVVWNFLFEIVWFDVYFWVVLIYLII